MLEDKQKSVEYWDKIAKDWNKMSYDISSNTLKFPFSQVRHKIVIEEIKKICPKDIKILDIGCADGKLTLNLVKAGYNQIRGVDNSLKMIEEAKENLNKQFPDLNPADIYFLGDADNFSADQKFDVVTAIGIIEYVDNPSEFFKMINNLLNEKGVAFIESRNKLFNAFSANDYTVNSDIGKLISEIDEINELSPMSNYNDVVSDAFIKIGKELKKIKLKENQTIPTEEVYPFKLPQYTPKEIMDFAEKAELKLKEIIYYHCHPFPPRFEKEFPMLFNKIGLLMQPLGYTPIGSLICSAFVAKIIKE